MCIFTHKHQQVQQFIMLNSKELSNLGVFRDLDDLLKCCGRFRYMDNNSLTLLPKDSYYTKLFIIACHRRIIHGGVAQTLSEVRKSHWIVQGRSSVRKAIRRCLICIHWEGGPFKTPPFAPLPGYVVSPSTKVPFTCVGIDYLGPLFINNGDELKKNWIC